MTSKVDASHVLSICDPGKRAWFHPRTPSTNCKIVVFEDTVNPQYDRSPTKDHVADMLEWARNLPDDAVLLVHCEAGISRSTAMALAILVQHHGKDNINRCVDLLFAVRPEASPNPLISKYADELLNCNGELVAAVNKLMQAKMFTRSWN